MEQISLGACPKCGGPAQFIEGGEVRHVDLRDVNRSQFLEAKPQRTAHWWFLIMVLGMLAVAIAGLADSIHDEVKLCYAPMQEDVSFK